MNFNEFCQYVYEFYNAKNGVYKEVGATMVDIQTATQQLINSGAEVIYDSWDRERVRSIIEETRKVAKMQQV